MATTNTQAAAANSVLVFPPKGLVIVGNVSAAAFCDAGKNQFNLFSTFCGTLASALQADLTEMLRTAGIDGQTSVGPISFGSDARRAASRAVRPLRTISAEAENIAKAFVVLDRQMKAHVFNPVQEAQEARERAERGAGMRLGA
jgi:hypothetical protein